MGNSDVVAAFGNTYVFYGKAAFYPAETSTWNPMERFAGKGSGNRRNLSIFSARDSVGGDDWNRKYHRDFHGDRDWRTGSDFLVLDHRCLRNRNLLCGVLFVSTFPGAKGRWILYWRTDVCDGACASSKKRGDCVRAGSCARLVWDGKQRPVSFDRSGSERTLDDRSKSDRNLIGRSGGNRDLRRCR